MKYTYILKKKLQDSKKRIDFSLNNIKQSDIKNYPNNIVAAYNVDIAYGGYMESRKFYEFSQNLTHTGLDIFVPKHTEILAPFNGVISNVFWQRSNNYKIGQGMGTQVITYHHFNDVSQVLGPFQTKEIMKNYQYIKCVFIHLDRVKTLSLYGKRISKKDSKSILEYSVISHKEIKKNKLLGIIGSRFENGGWAEHLHVETFLSNEIESIDFNNFEDFQNKGAIGVVLTKNLSSLKTNKELLINPNLIFGISNRIPEIKKTMNIKDAIENKNIITVKNLDISYGKTEVLKNINFAIKSGELVSILGPSGSGKTTLLNAISGFVKYKGNISIGIGNEQSDIGYVFQDNTMYLNQTAFKNIFLGAINNKRYKIIQYFESLNSVSSKEDKKKIQNISHAFEFKNIDPIAKEIFKKEFKPFKKYMQAKYGKFNFKKTLTKEIKLIANKLGIHDFLNKKIENLSGGQRQRVSIAKAMIKKPIFLIMDEPLANLDAQLRNESREWIKTFQREFKITLLFVTHDQTEAMLISDKILTLHNKKVEQFDTPEKIYNHPSSEFIAKFIGFPEINLVKKTQTYNTYVRPSCIKIVSGSNAHIYRREMINNNFIYHVSYKNLKLQVLSDKKIKIKSDINISWNIKDELRFKVKND